MTKHYLLTIGLGPTDLHGYVMCKNRRDLEPVINEMMDIAEKSGRMVMRACLVTELTTSIEIVRKIISEYSEVKRTLEAATDYHRTIFQIPTSDQRDHQLMQLH